MEVAEVGDEEIPREKKAKLEFKEGGTFSYKPKPITELLGTNKSNDKKKWSNTTTSITNNDNFIDLALHDDYDNEIRVLRFKPCNTTFGKKRSRRGKSFVCEICVETETSRLAS